MVIGTEWGGGCSIGRLRWIFMEGVSEALCHCGFRHSFFMQTLEQYQRLW